MEDLHAVILAGGSGTRLWPLSTPEFPKQFLPLPGGRSMIQETLARVRTLVARERVWVVTGRAFSELVRQHLPEVQPAQILEEPVGRNTAPAITWAASLLARRSPQATMAVFPADHVITKLEPFQRAIRFGYQLAQRGYLVTWGIRPTEPATGYGYIRFASPVADGYGHQAFSVEQFVEKPDLATAQRYLQDGHYVWNSGMFIWQAETILAEVRKHLPALAEQVTRIVEAMGTATERAVLEEVWPSLTSISIDYGVLEKTDRLVVIPVDIGWSDVGNWEQYGALYAADGNGLRGIGHHFALGSQNVFVYNTTQREIYTVGLKDVIVVALEDKTLICHKNHVQRVRELAEAQLLQRASAAVARNGHQVGPAPAANTLPGPASSGQSSSLSGLGLTAHDAPAISAEGLVSDPSTSSEPGSSAEESQPTA
uniref:mannose-1-phosphate guanylyltransferase n=1 Tax=Thermogemmatispora argillosa TaxID=2045280 RepID=A0A455T2C0_9CHLR|nr:mannose-1-phosphate guanylyltransferase [Thermogemmatispora argillosa]